MEKLKDIIGIDVSKLTFDAYCYKGKMHAQFAKNKGGFTCFHKWLKEHITCPSTRMIVLMEDTGLYTYRLERFLYAKKMQYAKKSALEIHRSAGVLRSKTDKTDAKMIATYGWRHREDLEVYRFDKDYRIHLRALLSHREMLINHTVAYSITLSEMQHSLEKKTPHFIGDSTEQIVTLLREKIKQVEQEICAIFQSDEELNENFKLITSIKGVGLITASYTLLYTNNFKNFENARKFISYCGLAPFEHSSGISLKGRARVSKFANKKMKAVLHKAAVTAVIHNAELKAYFERKQSEGKHKMSVYNAVRAKIVARMFAVVKRKSPCIDAGLLRRTSSQ